MVNPLASYFLRFYSVAIATLWATTFSLAVLFIPKLYVFWKRRDNNASEVNIEEQQQPPMGLGGDNQQQHSFLKSFTVYEPTVIDTSNLRKDTVDYSSREPEDDEYHGRYDSTNVYVEVQEVFV